MHPSRTTAQICFILSILNLVLAAPIMVWERHEVLGDEMVAAENAVATPKMWRELEAAWDGSTQMSPRSSHDAMLPSQNSPLSDGSASSGYPTPHLTEGSSESGNSWLLDRPPRLSLYEPAPPYPPSIRPLERQSSLPLLLQGLSVPSSLFSSPGPPEIPSPQRPQHPGLDQDTAGTYSPFTPLHHPSSSSGYSEEPISTAYASASGGSLPSHYFSASDGLAPSHNSISEGSPPSPPSLTLPNNAKFFNKNVMKRLGIVAGVVIVGGIIAGIMGSHIKHRDCQDS